MQVARKKASGNTSCDQKWYCSLAHHLLTTVSAYSDRRVSFTMCCVVLSSGRLDQLSTLLHGGYKHKHKLKTRNEARGQRCTDRTPRPSEREGDEATAPHYTLRTCTLERARAFGPCLLGVRSIMITTRAKSSRKASSMWEWSPAKLELHVVSRTSFLPYYLEGQEPILR